VYLSRSLHLGTIETISSASTTNLSAAHNNFESRFVVAVPANMSAFVVMIMCMN
jgi:hypothetical protein